MEKSVRFVGCILGGNLCTENFYFRVAPIALYCRELTVGKYFCILGVIFRVHGWNVLLYCIVGVIFPVHSWNALLSHIAWVIFQVQIGNVQLEGGG